jgi:predicted 3-demethylubiquinone-9 3-methyltransferase (glyoxalase superfamily)
MPTTKIIPHLWFDREAKEAAEFYTSVFPDARVTNVTTLHDTPSGDTEVVSFELAGQPFMAISAGPLFRINPSISFMLIFDPSREAKALDNLEAMWEKLAEGGTPLMPLDKYPFSERYGWIADRFGVTWQLILSDPSGEPRPFIVPAFLFVGGQAGRAEEAIEFWTSVFGDSKVGLVARYGPGQEPDREDAIMYADFMLEGQWFAAMDSAHAHDFAFNEAVSLLVHCRDQDEIDHFWGKLSAVPEAEQCGWLKDRFGVSWQIVPVEMEEMMARGTPAQIARVTEAFLEMKKFDIEALRRAYQGTHYSDPKGST